MGPDPADGAVVDAVGRLHGLPAIRIADASLFPALPARDDRDADDGRRRARRRAHDRLSRAGMRSVGEDDASWSRTRGSSRAWRRSAAVFASAMTTQP